MYNINNIFIATVQGDFFTELSKITPLRSFFAQLSKLIFNPIKIMSEELKLILPMYTMLPIYMGCI